MAQPEAPPSIDELVEVAAVETVVRLDGRPGRLSELVLTADVAGALGALLGAPTGDAGAAFFIVGHFGSGKSHLLAALAELAGDPAAAGLAGWAPDLRQAAARARPALVVAVPLVEHRAAAQLEDLVLGAAWAGLGRPAPTAGTDRRAAWDALLDASGSGAMVVLLDELSEFLRAKQGPALVEDLRFLQFLGEWARESPVVVVAALQESIEEVANVSQRELARIRDRYRTLGLSMRHVEDLVRGRLVRLRPGAEEWVERAHLELESAFPGWGVPLDRLMRCYPLHPATLSVLEGLRFLFSQQRGVVDFICRQLRGDPGAGIAPWQRRGYRDLLTPDRVYDHFRARLHERIETRRMAETVVPYYERAVDEVLETQGDRELGLRVVKLLCLLAASPVERPRSAPELADLLLTRLSALDPSANVMYLERAVLEPLVARGAYVVSRAGPPRVYTVELEADSAEVALSRQAQARAELSPGDRRVVRTLVELGSSATLPLHLLADVGPSRRELLWQNTLRSILVVPARVPEMGVGDVAGLVDQARSLGAEGCLVVAEPELDDPALLERARSLAASSERVAIWAPQPISGAAGAVDAAVELHCRRLVFDQARAEGRTEAGGLVEFLERSSSGDEARAREILQRAYFTGIVASGPPAAAVDLPSLAGLSFDRLLLSLADPLLSRLHPMHRDVAPRGELVGERLLRQLVTEVLTQPRIGAAAAGRGQLRSLIEGYLLPLGLVRRRADAYLLSPDPVRSPAVAEVLRRVPDGEPVGAPEVVRSLADGPVGLTEPEALLVLNACVQAGLLEIHRGRRQVGDPFLAVTPADRLRAAELLEPAARAALSGLGPIVGQGPWEPWNASIQRAAWERTRAWLEARSEDVAQVRAGLEAMADNALLTGVATDPVLADLVPVEALLAAVDGSQPPVPGLRQLLAAVSDADAIQLAARRVAAVARFFREELNKVEQAASYLTHPHLDLPEDAGRLRLLQQEAGRLIQGVLGLAAEDRVQELLAVEQEFRRAYVATYKEQHDRYYAGPAAKEAADLRSSAAYRALAALGELGAVAVPDDRVKIDRLLAAAAPAPCDRRLDLELSWKPRCSCGFALGQTPPVVDLDAVAATADRGVRQYLTELQRPEQRARLEGALEHLGALGRDEVAADLRAFLGQVAEPAKADPLAVAHLLGGTVGGVVRDVLSGGRLVVQRDVAGLREDLAGRRFTKRRLLELLTMWVDPDGSVPATGFVEVFDSAPAVSGAARSVPASGATADFLSRRFPRLAALLPGERAGECFWLAAWWAAHAEGAGAPAWIPRALLAEAELLAVAAEAAAGDLGARAELAILDGRVGAESLLGDQLAAALGLGQRSASEVAQVLAGERLLRHPLRLAAGDLARRLAADWQLAERLPGLDPGALASAHALAAEAELAPLGHVWRAGRHLAELERRLPAASCRDLVEDVYPSCWAPVPLLLSRAELASVGRSVLSAEALEAVRLAAARTLSAADAALRSAGNATFPGCLAIWDVGRAVLAPLLQVHERVAVLLVDAMRADVWSRVRPSFAEALAGRPFRQAWAVVPDPTRTKEAVAALYLGRPVAAGSGPDSPAELGPPFPHLGVEAGALLAADRDGSAAALRELWAGGPACPRISVAVATGVDEALHRSSSDLATLVDEVATGLERRVVPTLHALPAAVPLVVLADHGFRENPSWGRGPGGRYAHGGLSLEESVIPVAVFGPVAG